jgi:hypothetical protein
MARLNLQTASLAQPTVSGGRPTFEVRRNETIWFESPYISTVGSVELNGIANESARGWKLGFFQLQFIETNYARYRGRTSAAGSAKVSWNHLRICRDTDENSPGLWYDPQDYSKTDDRGVYGAKTLSTAGTETMRTGFGDAPSQRFAVKVRNTITNQDNFLHHADIAFHFCAMLVVEDPHHHFTFLKHFYWNVRWEAHFEPDAAGNPRLTRADHFELNVQRRVHSGVPGDSRFSGQVLSRSLPISNVMAGRAPRNEFSRDWSLS